MNILLSKLRSSTNCWRSGIVFLSWAPGAGTVSMEDVGSHVTTDPQQVYIAHLNPKVIPTEVLYGHIMLQSREWKDGLLSSIMRDLGQLEDDKPKWYVHSPI